MQKKNENMQPEKVVILGFLIALTGIVILSLHKRHALARQGMDGSRLTSLDPSFLASQGQVILECHIHNQSPSGAASDGEKSWFCNDAQALPLGMSVRNVRVYEVRQSGRMDDPKEYDELTECKVLVEFEPRAGGGREVKEDDKEDEPGNS